MSTYKTRIHGTQVAVLTTKNKSTFFKTLKLARECAKKAYPAGGYVIAFAQVAAGTIIYKA